MTSGERARSRHLGPAFGVTTAIIALDQVIKVWAVQALEGQPPRDFIGSLLRLDLVRNHGAAFSLGTEATVVFTILSSVVSLIIVRVILRTEQRSWALAFGGILGGAVGNLIDRIVRSPGFPEGHVVDMFRLPNFPVFNVADMAITFSAVALVWLSLRGSEPWPSTPAPVSPREDTP
jgi:signal peptidase II